MSIDNLNLLPHLAADYIREHGWTQGTEQDVDGHVCLTGALRLCSPIPGDGYIAREVFRRRQRAEGWNDEHGRTSDEVITYLAESEITDEELAETFGPQWREIVAQVRAISGATPQQITDLDAARDAARAAAWDAARDAVWALVTRDLIGANGYTQEHYDILTRPWRQVMGPLHADDAEMSR